jgi:hypothetical protein
MLINAYSSQVVTIIDYYLQQNIPPGGLQAVGDMREFMTAFGVKSSWLTGCTFRNIQAWVESRRPAIALIWYQPLVDAGLSHYKPGRFTHFVVVVGATDDSVIIHDPYYPAELGAYVTVPESVFMDAWNAVPPAYGPKCGAILPVGSIGDTTMPQEPGRYKVIATVMLNVRSGPGMSYPVVGSLKYGEVVNVTENLGGWGKIGAQRYAYMQYLERIEDPNPPPVDLVIRIAKTGEGVYTVTLPPGVTVETKIT